MRRCPPARTNLPADGCPPGRRVAGFLLLLVLAGCGQGPPPPATAPVGYDALRESISPADFGPLRGRRILLDPGHGGAYRGAVADNGLAEADINLGVALHLRGLLEWAGADVHMTRTADYDFLAGTDSTVAADLAFRVSIMDSLQPDVFISLHHNSNATRDPSRNETQTYYPLGDDGASLDLARAIHRHLALNLDIRPARLLPGNFHVLRHATVPAVLGEPAMISHPGVADRLELAEARRLEAEAYFLGLLEYFQGGDPGWLPAQPDTVVVGPAGRDLAWWFLPSLGGHDAAPAADAASFVLTRDGTVQLPALAVDGRHLAWHAPPPTGDATVLVEVRGRNLAGRAAPVQRTVLLPAAGRRLRVTSTRDETGAGLVRWSVPDGSPPPDGELVWPDGRRAVVGPTAAPGAEMLLETAPAAPPVFVPRAPAAHPVDVAAMTDSLPPGWHWQRVPGPPADRPWRARMLGPPTLPPRAGLGAVPLPPQGFWWWTTAGRRPLLAGIPTRPDYHEPVLPRLAGMTVVIDPAGGGAEAQGTGPTGLRGAQLNRGVAGELARLLAAAGARPVLTRDGPLALTNVAKVELAERTAADLLITVGRGDAAQPARVRHHPGSGFGIPWAEATAAALATFLVDTVPVEPSWNYLLRHTACPALEVALPHAGSHAAERLLESLAWQAAEARALLAGIARALAAPDSVPLADPAQLLPGLSGAPDPAAIDWALWDGEMPWYPLPGAGPAGDPSVDSWRAPGLPARGGLHTIEIHAGDTWQLWLIDLEQSADSRLLMSGTAGEPTPTVP